LVNITIYKKGLGIINGLFYVTSITHTFKIFIYTITFLILLLTSFYPRKYIKNNINNLINITVNTKDIILENIVTKEKVNKEEKIQNEINLLDMKIIKQTKIIDHSYHSLILNKKTEQFTIIEYTLIILLVIIGAMFLLSTCDFVSLFICIELQSYGLYILCALYKNSELSTSAALTYFLLGGLASCFILLGSALMYSNSANFNIDGLQIINSLSSNNLNNLDHIV
jgi:NADH-ubiquinone oxidoreductase chain 2